ncbi:hypothetical protein BDQ12DRAFT_389913 [Crucibulum laeve]|uniref:F-box domain-containing protein n=1 Tax=Crucibulum laeve TaxID=68775 RepID=A0A5C3MKC5_9AGAR|nr:hypothetical protein BDQ12DRAFT_389913 [Crucibulum laeve]
MKIIIPRETWAEVFAHCLPEQLLEKKLGSSLQDNKQYCNSSYAPLLLCHVSHAWREIATSQSPLWTSLSIEVSSGRASCSIDAASMWMNSSGVLPLSLSLVQRSGSDENRRVTEDFLELYARHIDRWKNVEFDILRPLYRNEPSRKREAPLLERCFIHNSRVNESTVDAILPMLGNVPILSNLCLNWYPQQTGNKRDELIPWQRLLHLELQPISSVQQTLNLLQECENVVECVLSIEKMDRVDILITIEHLSLTSLVLSAPPRVLSAFFEQVTFPALKTLSIRTIEPMGVWTYPIFDAFLKRSGCRILCLEFHNLGISKDDLETCLKHDSMQSLEELHIIDGRDWLWEPLIDDSLLRILTETTEDKDDGPVNTDDNKLELDVLSTGIALNLACISISGDWCIRALDGAFADMIGSRCSRKGSRGRLNRLELQGSKVVSEKDLRELRLLEKEGLQLFFPQ